MVVSEIAWSRRPLTRNPDAGLAYPVIRAEAGIQYTSGTLSDWIPAPRGNDGWKPRATSCDSFIQGGPAGQPVCN
jgi:hypothetical protein